MTSFNSNRNYLINFILYVFIICIGFIFIFSSEAYSKENVIEFYEAVVFTMAKSRFSCNTNFPNKANEIFQQLELKMRVNLSEKLFIYTLFKSEYSQFHWKRDDRDFFINSLGAAYKSKANINVKIGSLYLNYSPYLLKNYPWEGDIFRGLEFSFQYSGFSLQTFIANNGVNPEESGLFDAVPTIDVNIDRDYSTIDMGYTSAIEQKMRPTWWYGGKVDYKMPENDIFSFDSSAMFLNEELQYTSLKDLYSQVSKNRYVLGEINLDFFKYLKCNGIYGVSFSKIDNYTIQTNFFDIDKHLFNKKSDSHFQPVVWNAGIEIPSIAGKYVGIFQTAIELNYNKLDEKYAPVYLDNKYQIRRSFNPEDNSYSGREGYFGIVRQYFLKKTSIGYGYKEHKFKFNEIVPFLENGTAVEHQIRLEETYLKQFQLKFIYQFQKAKKGTFSNGVKKMNAFYIAAKSEFFEHISLEIEYANNLDYYKDFDQLAVKLLIWGF